MGPRAHQNALDFQAKRIKHLNRGELISVSKPSDSERSFSRPFSRRLSRRQEIQNNLRLLPIHLATRASVSLDLDQRNRGRAILQQLKDRATLRFDAPLAEV